MYPNLQIIPIELYSCSSFSYSLKDSQQISPFVCHLKKKIDIYKTLEYQSLCNSYPRHQVALASAKYKKFVFYNGYIAKSIKNVHKNS